MVLVEKINVIAEDDKFVLFLQTKEGNYFQYISKSFTHKMLDNKNKINTCILKEEQRAVLLPESEGSWEEILPQAKEVYIQKELLEFSPTEEHEEFVNTLITKEKMYDKSLEIKQKIELLAEAIADERFEDAAMIRDEIEKSNG